MSKNFYIKEITKDNNDDITIDNIVKLEKKVLEEMKVQGRSDQFFDTGKEGILEYVNSPKNKVIVALKPNRGFYKNNNLIAATYITGNQIPYTYNDITKYFKCGEGYKKYIKSTYSQEQYKKVLKKVYIEKILAFRCARDLILNEYLTEEDYQSLNESTNLECDKNKKFMDLINMEYFDSSNGFHEKSKIREDLNKIMSLYMNNMKKDIDNYEKFYWITFRDLEKELSENNSNEIHQFDGILSSVETYDKILEYQKYKIYEYSINEGIEKYYDANTKNTIEIDTYITSTDERKKGMAKIIVFEGIKKSLEEQYKDKSSDKVYIVSTLHKDNVSSKYVSEFFGLTDYLFVNRRVNRDRQVHILGMEKEQIPQYLSNMEKKLVVLYGYNPNNINVSNEERNKILNEQLKYEEAELIRLLDIEDTNYYGKYINGKIDKIDNLSKMLKREVINKEKEM